MTKVTPLGNSAEVSDYQPVTDELIEMCDMLFKSVGSVNIIIICIIANGYSRILHHIFYVAKARNRRVGKCLVLVRIYFHGY